MVTRFGNHIPSKPATPKAERKAAAHVLTPVSQVIPGRAKEMSTNSSGMPTFTVDPLTHVHRFLILGTEGGTYYSSEKKHTMQAYKGLLDAIKTNAVDVVDLIVSVSDGGHAPKNDPALFALACVMAHGTPEERYYARTKVNQVARTGTHILNFAGYLDSMKGWGSGTKKSIANWFLEKEPKDIAFQYAKYSQRDGWSMRDLLRKSHPWGTVEQNRVFELIAHPETGVRGGVYPPILWAAHQANIPDQSHALIRELITEHGLSWEMLPNTCLNNPSIWRALLPKLPLRAMIRQLPKLSQLGVVATFSDEAKFIVERLTDPENIRKSRIHPLAYYNALTQYRTGQGRNFNWVVNTQIVDALEAGFLAAFNFVEPSGKNIMLALDISSSMGTHAATIPGTAMTAREASAVMALVTAKTEPNYTVWGFARNFIQINITKSDSFADVIKKISGLPFGNTNCSLPATQALEMKMPVDCFQIYTDNDTNAGVHPAGAMARFRKEMNKPTAKLAAVAMVANKFTIADPKDPYSMDFVGFDSSAPQAMAAFTRL